MDASLLWVQTAMLASVRLTLGLAMTPLFSAFGVPMLARLILTLALAGLVARCNARGSTQRCPIERQLLGACPGQ